ncbi:MAG: hypothetical protein OXE86_09275 [Alphaproteobacteria bacterium]|nr:hypothetical protein [Alphaproteobacteria bacterium]
MTGRAGETIETRAAALRRAVRRQAKGGPAPSLAEIDEMAALIGAMPELPTHRLPRRVRAPRRGAHPCCARG